MDSNDIEMVAHRGDDEVGPAEDLNLVTATESKLYSQNRYFTVGMVVCLVVMFFVIGNRYQREDVIEMISNHGDAGIITQVDGEAVAAGAQQLQLNEHTKPKPHLGNHSSAGSDGMTGHDDMINPSLSATTAPSLAPDKAPPSEVQAWLDGNVTLTDGIKYKVLKQIFHDKESFTEGLTFCEGKLYESVGMRKVSALLVLHSETGETLEKYTMEPQYFAEGLTCVGNQLIQLTYTKKKGFIYDRNNLQNTPREFSYDTTTGEGWGLTYDGDRHELIVSDGSDFLRTCRCCCIWASL